MIKKLKLADFPFQKGDKVWVMVGGKNPCKTEVIGISPTNNGVRLKDIGYWNKQDTTHVSKIGKTKAEVIAKALIKETETLEYSVKRLIREVQRRNDNLKKISKLCTKLKQCFK